MVNVDIINESPVTMAELKEKIEDIKKRDKELKPRTLKTHEYLERFVSIKGKDAVKIKEQLLKLQISRIKERHIAKIIDIMPKDIETLKLIFVGENVTLKQDDLETILEALK